MIPPKRRQPKPKPPPEIPTACFPDPLLLEHGESGFIEVLPAAYKHLDLTHNVKAAQRLGINLALPDRMIVTSLHRDPPPRIEIIPLKVVLTYANRPKELLFCLVGVFHSGIGKVSYKIGENGPAFPRPKYKCVGAEFQLFSNWNADIVGRGGTLPTFDTHDKPVCLVSISTYHWNEGRGEAPGLIALFEFSGPVWTDTLGPWKATGSAGQGGAPNVNWTVTLSPSQEPVVLDGTYSCEDSDPGTWSQNAASGGQGFCAVWVTDAQKTGP